MLEGVAAIWCARSARLPSGVLGLHDYRNSGALLMKFLKRLTGAFEGALLVATTVVMIAPFLLVR
jgi:hypothetical protein